MKTPTAKTLKQFNRPTSIEHFDRNLMRSITPATNPALDENPEFGPAKQSRYDAETLRNWSQHFPGCPPPSFGKNMTCREFSEHITSTDNLVGE